MRLCVLLCAVGLCATVAGAQDISPFYDALSRETLPANDGWAAFGAGTTGGSAALPARVFIVGDRAELIASLAGTAPKIIFVSGTIHLNVDDAGQALSCDDYAAGTRLSLEAYLLAFDPATWGRTRVPSGPLETARNAAHTKQQNRIRVNLTSNTTLVGLGPDARIVGAHVRVNNIQNVIIREHHVRGCVRLLSAVGPDRRSAGQLEFVVRQHLAHRRHQRVGRSQRVQRRRAP